MSTKPERGARTPGVISWRPSIPKRNPKPERCLRVARAYCLRAEIAVRAAIATETRKSGKDASEATIAYQSVLAAYKPRPDLPPLTGDMEGEADLGRKWTDAIVRVTRRYFDNARMERKAASIASTQKWIEDLGKAAAALATVYYKELDPLAKSVARADIEAHLAEGERLSELVQFAQRLGWIAPIVAREIGNEPGCKDGMAWEKWIVDLSALCHENGLPTSVTHDLEVRSDQLPSQFVLLVEALMRELPRNLRRHDKSYGSLANAVSKARNAADKLRRSRDEQAIHCAE